MPFLNCLPHKHTYLSNRQVPYNGNTVYDSPGTYTFIVPNDVYVIHVDAIGAGQGGGFYVSKSTRYSPYGGGGGAFAWFVGHRVTPGQSFTVKVGLADVRPSSQGGGSLYGSWGGDTTFTDNSNNVELLKAEGGGRGSSVSRNGGWNYADVSAGILRGGGKGGSGGPFGSGTLAGGGGGTGGPWSDGGRGDNAPGTYANSIWGGGGGENKYSSATNDYYYYGGNGGGCGFNQGRGGLKFTPSASGSNLGADGPSRGAAYGKGGGGAQNPSYFSGNGWIYFYGFAGYKGALCIYYNRFIPDHFNYSAQNTLRTTEEKEYLISTI
jgi:hypothetical protein